MKSAEERASTNSKIIVGSQPLSDIQEAIEAALGGDRMSAFPNILPKEAFLTD